MVPPGVAQMLLGRVQSISPTAQEVAAALAIAARPLTEAELASCASEAAQVVQGLKELLDARLVDLSDGDRYRLKHALLEDAVRATLLASQRLALHGCVAQLLADRGDTPPGEISAHWQKAGKPAQEAVWSVAAARNAETVFAWQEAARAWERVWDLCWILPPPDRPTAVGPAEAAAACLLNARRAGDDVALGRLAERAFADEEVQVNARASATVLWLYSAWLTLTDAKAGIAALQEAVSLFERSGEPAAGHAHALIDLVTAKRIHHATTGTESAELSRAASIAAEAGSPEVLCRLPSTTVWSCWTQVASKRASPN